MRISFLAIDKNNEYRRSTYYTSNQSFCATCREEYKRIGPRKFWEKVMKVKKVKKEKRRKNVD